MRRLGLALTVLLLLGSACSGSRPEACAPNMVINCTCSDGRPGALICKDDGSGFTPCGQCGMRPGQDGGSADLAAGPDRQPPAPDRAQVTDGPLFVDVLADDVLAPVDLATGSPCGNDDDCPGQICNLETDLCASPGPDGTPCFRDLECQNGLCNAELDSCQPLQPIGGGCFRDVECENMLCNAQLDSCQPLQPIGGACFRDVECENMLCNADLDTCQPPQSTNGPCFRDVECESMVCLNRLCS